VLMGQALSRSSRSAFGQLFLDCRARRLSSMLKRERHTLLDVLSVADTCSAFGCPERV
jgi:hypothetical protein